MNPDDFPSIPEALINELERLFPAAVPINPNITLSEINRIQGNQEVITFLRMMFMRQQERVLRKEDGI